MKEFKVGYTQGVYDMFHIGHLNLLNHAKEYCDILVVGVNSDELVRQYKHKTPVISENARQMIVANIKAVDECIIVGSLDKMEIWDQIHFEAIFIGDDWKGHPRWLNTEKELSTVGAKVVYLPHTDGVSSTMLKQVKEETISD